MTARSNVDELRDGLDRLGIIFIGKVLRLISQGKESLGTYEIETSPIYEQAVNFLKQPFPESLVQQPAGATESRTFGATGTSSTRPEATESTTTEATESTTLKATEQTTPEATEPTAQEVIESTTPEATESTTPGATESTTLEATESTTLEATESTTWEATESTIPEAAESTSPEATELTTPEVTGQTTSGATGMSSTTADVTGAESIPNPTDSRNVYANRCDGDTLDPEIIDIKKIRPDVVVVADYKNRCVKVFHTSGELLSRKVLVHKPQSLIVIDSSPSNHVIIGAISSDTNEIAIVEVIDHNNDIYVQDTIETRGRIGAIAVVNERTLVFGYRDRKGIDLLDIMDGSESALQTLDDTLDENAQEIYVNREGHLDILELNGSIQTVRRPDQAVQQLVEATGSTSGATGMSSTTADVTGAESIPNPTDSRNVYANRCDGDTLDPEIVDIKEIRPGRVIVADFKNRCVKVFHTSGGLLSRKVLVYKPQSLIVIDSSHSHYVRIGALSPACNAIAIVEVIDHNSDVYIRQDTVETRGGIEAIAVVNRNTLVFGYIDCEGIDLLDIRDARESDLQTLGGMGTRYQTECYDDENIPTVEDVTLLGGRLVVVADNNNYKVKLFTLEGQHIDSLKVDDVPWHLAVMDPTASDTWRVAVSTLDLKKIIMMEVTPVSIKRSSSIRMSRECVAITAVDSSTLAVGYGWDNPCIDLIDTNGDVLRSLCGGIRPRSMSLTKDQSHIIMSTNDGTLAKVRLEDGTVVYNHKVRGISRPQGVAPLQDGRCFVADRETSSLHLINRDGGWERELWRDHKGYYDLLLSVCESGGVCVAVTTDGSLFVFDLL